MRKEQKVLKEEKDNLLKDRIKLDELIKENNQLLEENRKDKIKLEILIKEAEDRLQDTKFNHKESVDVVIKAKKQAEEIIFKATQKENEISNKLQEANLLNEENLLKQKELEEEWNKLS